MLNIDSNNFKVELDNYQGPLDILLDLAKAQKVDLEDISITLLADQFHDYITKEKNLDKYLTKIETRKVMLPTNSFLKKKYALENALKFEEIYILQKKELYDLKLSSEILRLSNLNTRK